MSDLGFAKGLGPVVKYVQSAVKPRDDLSYVASRLEAVALGLKEKYSAALGEAPTLRSDHIAVDFASAPPSSRYAGGHAIPQYVLLAERGAGKTSQLLRWAVEAADNLDVEALCTATFDSRLALYIDVSFRGPKSVASLVADTLEEVKWDKNYEHEAVRGGRLCLLIDGIDELDADEQQKLMKDLRAYLGINLGTAVAVSTSSQAVADTILDVLRDQRGCAFSLQNLPLPSAPSIEAYLLNQSEGDLWVSISSLMTRDVLRLPLVIHLLSTITAAGVEPAELAQELGALRDDAVVPFLISNLVDRQPDDDARILSWLAEGTRATGSSVAFQLQSVDPRWLRSGARARAAYFLTGGALAAPLSLLATIAWCFRLRIEYVWIPILAPFLLVGLVALCLSRLLYRSGRRFPVRAVRRVVRWKSCVVGAVVHWRAYVLWITSATFVGVLIGIAFHGIGSIAPVPDALIRIMVATGLSSLFLMLVSGLGGQLLTGLTIGWAADLATGNFLIDVAAGLFAGALGAAIFRFTDYGEVVEPEKALAVNIRQLLTNVRAQMIFETLKWSGYSFAYAGVMYWLTDDSQWFRTGFAGSLGVGFLAFGVYGALYAPIAAMVTLRLAEQELGLDAGRPLVQRVDGLRARGLLFRGSDSGSLRFPHPTFVDELIGRT